MDRRCSALSSWSAPSAARLVPNAQRANISIVAAASVESGPDSFIAAALAADACSSASSNRLWSMEMAASSRWPCTTSRDTPRRPAPSSRIGIDRRVTSSALVYALRYRCSRARRVRPLTFSWLSRSAGATSKRLSSCAASSSKPLFSRISAWWTTYKKSAYKGTLRTLSMACLTILSVSCASKKRRETYCRPASTLPVRKSCLGPSRTALCGSDCAPANDRLAADSSVARSPSLNADTPIERMSSAMSFNSARCSLECDVCELETSSISQPSRQSHQSGPVIRTCRRSGLVTASC
mmetsp:Transcript_14666/g.42919  ORF Transcript_14666/g.42919 Transcript_14666/m.42919 type:complete len:296 (+) Transcript_14666:1574-2461(+)